MQIGSVSKWWRNLVTLAFQKRHKVGDIPVTPMSLGFHHAEPKERIDQWPCTAMRFRNYPVIYF